MPLSEILPYFFGKITAACRACDSQDSFGLTVSQLGLTVATASMAGLQAEPVGQLQAAMPGIENSLTVCELVKLKAQQRAILQTLLEVQDTEHTKQRQAVARPIQAGYSQRKTADGNNSHPTPKECCTNCCLPGLPGPTSSLICKSSLSQSKPYCRNLKNPCMSDLSCVNRVRLLLTLRHNLSRLLRLSSLSAARSFLSSSSLLHCSHCRNTLY